jgi:hypothetical protein
MISKPIKAKEQATQTQGKLGVISGAPEGLAVPIPITTPIVLLLNDTNKLFNQRYKKSKLK